MLRKVEDDPRKTPDDSPVGLYLAIGTDGEPELIHSLIPGGATVLDLGCGVGRITHPLVALGHPVVAVDESPAMLEYVRGAEKVQAKVQDLDLGRTFQCVLLMSNLVNGQDTSLTQAFLRSCRRHVAPEGVVIIERYDPKGKIEEGVYEGDYGGLHITVERTGSGPSAHWKITYEHPDGRHWTQQGRGVPRLLGDDEMRADLEEAGLRLERIFGPKRRWVLARPEAV